MLQTDIRFLAPTTHSFQFDINQRHRVDTFIMRFQASTVAVAALIAGAVAETVSYDGWKVFRVDTPEDDSGVIAELERLNTVVEDDHGAPGKLQVAVAPEDLDAFVNLGYESIVLEEDLGADIASEQKYAKYARVSK